MPEDLLREIRKLEVRLENWLRENEEFVKNLRECISGLKDLNGALERLESERTPGGIEDLRKIQSKVAEALGEALTKEGEAQHEMSHLLESYGGIIKVLKKLGEKPS